MIWLLCVHVQYVLCYDCACGFLDDGCCPLIGFGGGLVGGALVAMKPSLLCVGFAMTPVAAGFAAAAAAARAIITRSPSDPTMRGTDDETGTTKFSFMNGDALDDEDDDVDAFGTKCCTFIVVLVGIFSLKEPR